MLHDLECRGATIFILAILTVLVLSFIGAATILKPEAAFDPACARASGPSSPAACSPV
jgi:hypothetical protein